MRDATQHDKLVLCRADAHEYAGFVQLHAEIIQRCIEVGDDIGTIYATKRMIAYARATKETAHDIALVLDEIQDKNARKQSEVA